MRYIIFCCTLMCFFFLPNFASADIQQLFDQANSEYIKKNYSVAIHDYESIIRNNGGSPALFYNLGLAYAQAGQSGKAILNMERARNLAPGDSEITAFLAEFKKKQGVFTAPPEGAEKITSLLDINQWALLGFASLLLFSFTQLLSLLLQEKKKFWLLLTNKCSLIATVLIFSVVAYMWDEINPYIVTTESGKLLISPIKEADLVLSLREGQQLFPIKKHGEYLYVRDSHNRKGWILSHSLEAVNNPQIFNLSQP